MMSPNSQLRHVLVYCPNTGGHRHLYLKRICDLLLEADCKVVVFAVGALRSEELKLFEPFHSPYLGQLKQSEQLEWIDVFEQGELFRDEASFIRKLQHDYGIELTLFPDGDALLPVFNAISCKQKDALLGRNYALFIRSEFLHQSVKNVPTNSPFSSERYHAFFGKNGLCKRVLDGCIVTDERFVEEFGEEGFFYLPDIVLADEPGFSEPSADSDAFLKRVREFMQLHRSKTLLLSLGTLEERKGFDFLLRYAEQRPETAVLRVGLTNPQFAECGRNFADLRKKLEAEQRILEIERFLGVQEIQELLNAVPVVLLPYKDFLRTSGFMLDCVARLKPVLVPDVGVMADRVERYGLGLCFRNGDYADFEAKADALISAAPDRYRQALEGYREGLLKPAQKKVVQQILDHAFASQKKLLIQGSDELNVDSISSEDVEWTDRLLDRSQKLRALEIFFDTVSNQRAVVFGAGLYARWLENMSSPENVSGQIVAIADSHPKADIMLWGQPVTDLESVARTNFDVIILATEQFQTEMTLRCRQVFGDDVPVVDLNPILLEP